MSGEKANTGKNFNKKKFIEDVKSTLRRRYRMDATEATQHQLYMAVSEVIEDAIIDQWMKSCQRFEEQKNKIVYYLSMEFLIGRFLQDGFAALQDDIEEFVVIFRIAGRLLHGFSGFTGIPRIWLRHPLSLWHVQAED